MHIPLNIVGNGEKIVKNQFEEWRKTDGQKKFHHIFNPSSMDICYLRWQANKKKVQKICVLNNIFT